LVNHPDAIEHVLQKRSQNYDKATRSAGYIRSVCGNSLLTSNGSEWQEQRRLVQPLFHAGSVRGYASLMTERTLALFPSWRQHARTGQPLDMASEMMRLTYSIAAKAFFNAGAPEEADTIEQAMHVILPHTFGRLQKVISLPPWVPTGENRRFRAARRALDEMVFGLIARRRAAAVAVPSQADMLGMLLNARDERRGGPLTDLQIRDQTVTFLLAGHETTSNALTWTLYLLATHPEVQTALRAEVQAQLSGGVPTLDQLPNLQTLRQVLREALRLYPPIWIIERRVIKQDCVSGFDFPAGSAVVICPYTLHRHPGFWERPDDFCPERFAGSIPRAYLPFGAGPRHCIGSEFAMLEAQLIIALLVRDFRFQLATDRPIQPLPGITLRVRDGLPIRVSLCS
jgi:cytochrome P450